MAADASATAEPEHWHQERSLIPVMDPEPTTMPTMEPEHEGTSVLDLKVAAQSDQARSSYSARRAVDSTLAPLVTVVPSAPKCFLVPLAPPWSDIALPLHSFGSIWLHLPCSFPRVLHSSRSYGSQVTLRQLVAAALHCPPELPLSLGPFSLLALPGSPEISATQLVVGPLTLPWLLPPSIPPWALIPAVLWASTFSLLSPAPPRLLALELPSPVPPLPPEPPPLSFYSESNIADTMKMSLNLHTEEDISTSTSCDERKNNKTRIQEMITKNPRTEASCHLHVKSSERSSGKERRVDEADVEAESGSDYNSKLNHEHLEATSITNVKVNKRVDITTPCELATVPRNQHEAAADECEVEGNVADNLKSSHKQVLKNQVVFATIKKRGMEGSTENRPYKCTYCNWAFKKSSNLLSHIDTHRGLKPHVCDLCGKAYSHQGTLQQHKRLHTGERPYQCPFCDKNYIWSSDFRKHIRTHTGEKPYICEECGKDFVRSSDLRKHERNMHTNNKPFLCKQCGKTFNKPLSLLRHERTHLGERPFVCPECGKAFALASRMTEHRKIHSGVRPYACSICSKAFTKSSNLTEHLTVHSGVRPHKCSECGVAFAVASRLARHQRIHAAVRSYHCQRCDMSFGQLAALKRHEKQHGEGMIFVCGQCSKSFPRDSLLTEHMQSHANAKTCVPTHFTLK
ncbi:unnamed protein product [Leuciscus chuanchicus]